MSQFSIKDYKDLSAYLTLIGIITLTAIVGFGLAYMATIVFGYNYPSHHTLYAFIGALTIYVFYPKSYINLVCTLGAVAIGVWRVVGGYHSILEVICGFTLAIMSVFIVGTLILWVKNGK